MGANSPDTEGGKTLAMRLRTLMEERDYSHRRLAADIGASKQSVTNWTQGHNEPSLPNLRALARALDVAPAHLIEARAETNAAEESLALVRELTALSLHPALDTLSGTAPSLLDLLSRAEQHVGNLDRSGPGD